MRMENCESCGLVPDLCVCKEENKEKERQKRLESLTFNPEREKEKCVICGRMCNGLMDFASHVAQIHGISALQYWTKYGHNGEKQSNEEINPSKRKEDLSWREK